MWQNIRNKIRAHRAVLVFAAIGAINTALHAGTVTLLVENALAQPVLANVAGFALANSCSFLANARFTFQRKPSFAMYRKFLAVSMASLMLTIGLAALAQHLQWHYLAGLAMVILCGPVLTFLLHKAFTFRAVQS